MTKKGLEQGTAIFNSAGRTEEVALDRREKGGKLWGKAPYTRRNYRTGQDEDCRHELHGLWLSIDDNEGLSTFCGHQQGVALKPLREQIEALNRRIGQVKAFAGLTFRAVAGETVSDEVVASIIHDVQYANIPQRQEIRDRLGEPKEGNYYATYTVRLKKPAPQGVGGPVLVYGDKGVIEITPPVELLKAGEEA